jgi:hypothetical protein
VLIVILAFVSFGVFAGLLMSGTINREVFSEIEVINEGGNKTALVVYQPGFSSFPSEISHAFADGLASNGWRVEITTASPQTPNELSKYSLLTLAYPVYGGTPGTAIVSYLSRISSLDGTSIVILVCGGGDTGEIQNPLAEEVQAINGTFYKALTFSNQEGFVIDKATEAGSTMT